MNVANHLRRDLTLACRSLWKAKAFTLVCVLSLGIGMVPVIAVPYGARIFTSPPPTLNIDGLVEVLTASEGSRRATDQWSYPDFGALAQADPGLTLSAWAARDSFVQLASAKGDKTETSTMFVSPEYFGVVDVALARGPGFGSTPDPIVIVSHGFWQRRLDAAADVVGSSLVVDGTPHTIVGVMPEGFGGHLGYHDFDLFAPLDRHPLVLGDPAVRFDRAQEWVRLVGRLRSGTTVNQASAAVAALTAQLAQDFAATNALKSGVVMPYHAIGNLDGSVLPIIQAVWQALTTLPLLVVCLNIASMVQVRNAMRERELSIRQAIGASRGRLMQQLLAESVVLALVGGALASLLLFNVAPITAWWSNAPLPAPMANALRVDASMIAVCVGLCLATSLVFGWLPAARFSRPVVVTALKDDAGGGSVRVGRVQRVATALQVAIATPLLVLGGMTLDRVRATATDDLGFDAELVYGAPVDLDTEPHQGWARLQGVRDALARTDGVASVTITDGLPLDFRYRMTRVATQVDPGTAPTTVATHVTRVGDAYFDTLGIEVIRGRRFDGEDGAGAELVTIVSKPLAERLFPGEDPLGKRVTFAAGETSERTLTIVGVSSDFPTSQMSTNRAQLLLSIAQFPDVRRDSVEVTDDRGSTARVMLVVRSVPGVPAESMAAALTSAVRELDPEFESTAVVAGVWLRQNSVRDFMTQTMVSAVVGGVLLLLAALGIYGVVGLMVASRIREIAVRVALGASRRRVIGMVLTDVLKLVAPGVVVGLLIAVAFVRLNGEDFGIALSALEPLAYLVGAAIAVLMSLAASLAPARWAASVQPMVAMRSE